MKSSCAASLRTVSSWTDWALSSYLPAFAQAAPASPRHILPPLQVPGHSAFPGQSHWCSGLSTGAASWRKPSLPTAPTGSGRAWSPESPQPHEVVFLLGMNGTAACRAFLPSPPFSFVQCPGPSAQHRMWPSQCLNEWTQEWTADRVRGATVSAGWHRGEGGGQGARRGPLLPHQPPRPLPCPTGRHWAVPHPLCRLPSDLIIVFSSSPAEGKTEIPGG